MEKKVSNQKYKLSVKYKKDNLLGRITGLKPDLLIQNRLI
jgi:hypothetical protein